MKSALYAPSSTDGTGADERLPGNLILDLVDRFRRGGLDRLSPCTSMALAHLAIVAGVPDLVLFERASRVAETRSDTAEAALFRKAARVAGS